MVSGALDLVGKLSEPAVAERVDDVRRGIRPRVPVVVDLDPTSFCDLACPACISKGVLAKGKFSRERLHSLASELVSMGVLAVVLIGGGEPLLHPGTGDLIRRLSLAGIQVGVVTNGTLIDRHLSSLSNHTAWVRVSVDAATSATYQLIRPAGKRKGSQFLRVIENMRTLARLSRGKVGYSFMISPAGSNKGRSATNIQEISSAAALAKSLGCAYLEVKAMMAEDHNLAPLTKEQIRAIADQIEAAEQFTSSRFEVLVSSNLRHLIDADEVTQTKDYASCAVTQLRTLVTPQGMFPCSYHRGNPAFRYGDPTVTNIEALWQDDARPTPDPRHDCRFFCARHDTNVAIENGIASRSSSGGVCEYDPFI